MLKNLRKRGLAGFSSWHDIKESSWRFPNPLFAAIGIPTGTSAFHIPNALGQPTPFPSAPFHFTIWMTHLFDVKHITWAEKGRKSLSKRENMRELWLRSYRTCPTHELTAWNYYHICYCCFSCYSFILLVSIWNSIISSIFSVDDLPDLTLNISHDWKQSFVFWKTTCI